MVVNSRSIMGIATVELLAVPPAGCRNYNRPDRCARAGRVASRPGSGPVDLPFRDDVRIKLSVDIQSKPIEQRIEWLMAHARRRSETFTRSETALARQRYLAQHTSAVAALKCMDECINLAVATHTRLRT